MKALKVLAIISIAGITSIQAQDIGDRGDCNKKQQMQNQSQHTQQIQRQGKHGKKMQRENRRKNPNRRINRLLRSLGLTDTQKTQLRDICKSMRESNKRERKAFRGSQNLKHFISIDRFDKEAFIEVSTQKATTMTKVRADMLEKMIAVLTPEQKIALVEKLNREAKRKSRRQ